MSDTSHVSYFQQRMAEIAANPALRRTSTGARRYLSKEKNRHGKTVYYFRRGKEARVRLPDLELVGEIAFQEAYEAADAGRPLNRPESPTRVLPSYMEGVGKPGYVYFIRMSTYIKIGFSKTVGARLKAIQVACPEPAEIVKVIPGSQNTERYFHQHFARYRLNGEWFSLEGDLCTFLAVNVS